MKFMGPEESGVVAVSRTLGSSLSGVFAVGTSLLMLLPSLRVEVKGWKSVTKVGTVAHNGLGFPWGLLLIWVSLAFYIFPCTWKLLPSWLQ
jgi:hypothetical protein